MNLLSRAEYIMHRATEIRGPGYSDFNHSESNVMSLSGPADSVKLVFQKHGFSRSLIALDGHERSIRAGGLYW
jgi:hypothetical protein